MHLAYFDEAGTDGYSPFVIVGSVVFPSGSFGWVERLHNIAIEQIVPADKLGTFEEFHASELFLGRGPFEGIEEQKRFTAIRVLLMAIQDQQLPYIYGAVDRKKLAKSVAGSARPVDFAFRLCYRSLRAAHLYAPIEQNRLWHAHDAMFFTDSRDSVGIQMADLCNYLLSRRLQKIKGGEEFSELVAERAICAKPEPEWSKFGEFLVCDNAKAS